MQPIVIQVYGDKTRKIEPEHHRIEFPGGFICVDRTTDGEYWAHIVVNHPDANCYQPRGLDTLQGAADGRVTDFRADYHDRHASDSPAVVPELEKVYHVAVRIALS